MSEREPTTSQECFVCFWHGGDSFFRLPTQKLGIASAVESLALTSSLLDHDDEIDVDEDEE